MQSQTFEYYAFISYNHKDAKQAKQLQRQLEHYHLPSALRRERPDLPKRITPVFLDCSDLVARSSLFDSLQDKLDASGYLIVLCSPNSATSSWVNDEVEYFISTGRKDQIIPLIISGKPHAANPAQGCYPPALASLPNREELLGISVRDYGRRGAFLRVIATLLDLKLDQVIARDAAVRRRRFALYASALLLVVLTALSLIWYNVPHTAYYMDYTYRWEKPVGLQAVSSRRRKQLDYTYRFTTLWGDVVQVERVNSAGVLTTSFLPAWEDPPSMRFYYGMSDGVDGRSVTRVACYDAFGQQLYEKHYSADLGAVDFVQSGNGSASFSLGTDLLSSQAEVGSGSVGENRGDVIRYVQTYDGDGCLIRRMFKRDNRGSSGGTPARDENGVWGTAFLRDGLGRVIGIRSLDRDGAFMADSAGIAGFDYVYGEFGRVTSRVCVDLSGSPVADRDNVTRSDISYDNLGRMVETACFDAKGKRVINSSNGVSVIRYGRDSRGFITSQAFYDHMLKPCCDPSGICLVVGDADDNGRPIRQDLYGPDGELQPCVNGFAGMTYTYNSSGQTTRVRYFGTDGQPAPELSLNVYGIDYVYTDGLLTQIDYVDGQDRPMRNKYGAASLRRYYNAERQLSQEQCLDEDGSLVRCTDGYAETRYTYTDGNCTRADYYDETGALCRNSSGVASYVRTFQSGQLTAQSCFGPEGEPVFHSEGWHSVVRSFDEEGLFLRESYYGTQGERVITSVGYSAVSMVYDDAGRVTRATYFDTEDQEITPVGKSDSYYGAVQIQLEYDQRGRVVRRVFLPQSGVPDPREIYEVRYDYDDYGNTVSEHWRDSRGMPALNSAGYSDTQFSYDRFRRTVEKRWFDAQGMTVYWSSFVYDRQGWSTQITVYGADGSIQLVENNVYDEFGNWIQRSYTDGKGQPCMTEFGFATACVDYDVLGNATNLWYYDETGSPCDSIYHRVYSYSITGKTLTEESYDGKGSSSSARTTHTTAATGWLRRGITMRTALALAGRFMTTTPGATGLGASISTDIVKGDFQIPPLSGWLRPYMGRPPADCGAGRPPRSLFELNNESSPLIFRARESDFIQLQRHIFYILNFLLKHPVSSFPCFC